jgi:hypothetical protein
MERLLFKRQSLLGNGGCFYVIMEIVAMTICRSASLRDVNRFGVPCRCMRFSSTVFLDVVQHLVVRTEHKVLETGSLSVLGRKGGERYLLSLVR